MTETLVQCSRCDNYSFDPLCQCKRYLCWYDEGDIKEPETEKVIYAYSVKDAAEIAANEYWQDEISEDTLDVWVSMNGEIVEFVVDIQMVAEFTARRK